MPRMSYSALDTDGSPTADPIDGILRRHLAAVAAGSGGGRPARPEQPSANEAGAPDPFAQFARNKPSVGVRGWDDLSPSQVTKLMAEREVAMQDARNGGDPGVRYAQSALAINQANDRRRDITNLDTPEVMAAKRQAALSGLEAETASNVRGQNAGKLNEMIDKRILDEFQSSFNRGGSVGGTEALPIKDIIRARFGLPPEQDQAVLTRLQNVQLQNRLTEGDVQALNSPVPAVRMQAASRLRKRGLDVGDGSLGPKGDPVATESFLSTPAAKVAVDEIIKRAKSAADSFNPEIAAQDVRTALMNLAEQARQAGADPEQISAMVMDSVRKAVPRTTFWNSPIRTAVGLGGALFDTSENAFNDALSQ